MILDLSLLKNKYVGFKTQIDGKEVSFCKKVVSAKQNKKNVVINYEDKRLEIPNNDFLGMLFTNEGERYYFVKGNENTLNCFVGFTMFSTYGFPVELIKEMSEEDGLELDMTGYQILKDLEKQKSKENSSVKNYFDDLNR